MKMRVSLVTMIVLIVLSLSFSGCVTADSVTKEVDKQLQSMQKTMTNDIKFAIASDVKRDLDEAVANLMVRMQSIEDEYQKIPQSNAQLKQEIIGELNLVRTEMAEIQADYDRLLGIFFSVAENYGK
jgi:peptidoglycan hydrolase CwlO-like protein